MSFNLSQDALHVFSDHGACCRVGNVVVCETSWNPAGANSKRSSYYNSDYSSRGDSSCFRSTGLPAMYACSSHGG